MHRTTVILEPTLEKRLRKKARQAGKTLTEMIQDFIREGLARVHGERKGQKVSLPDFSMGEAVVDPSDRSRLWDLLDER